ncbi:hypothetical protein DEF23_10465, partial [Marinitenerispora sediminis]
MPELHETMNIFADSKDDGDHPPMPAMSEVTKDPWLTHGYYHFWEDDHFIHGHSFKNMNLWFSWNESTQTWTGRGWTYSGGTDYSGYWFEPTLYGADSAENKFRNRLLDLRNVMVLGNSIRSGNYSTQTHWDIAGEIASADDFFSTQRDGIFERFKEIDVPDSPMQGDGAAAFAAHLYKLGTYLESLTAQLDVFHNAVNDVRPGITSAIMTLANQIDSWNANYKGIYELVYDWYNAANASLSFNEARDQMWINVNPDTNDWGVVGDAGTDARVNALLHDRWRKQLDGVIDAAAALHKTMETHYDTVTGRIKRIAPTPGTNPPGYTPPDGEGGPGNGNNNPWDNPPDWLDEYMNTPPPKLEFEPPPEYEYTPPPGPGPGSGMGPPPNNEYQPPPIETYSGPGGGSSLPPPGGDYQPPPVQSFSGPGGGSSLPPPGGSFGGPGNSSLLPPPTESFGGPGSGSSMPPPSVPETIGGPGNGSNMPPPSVPETIGGPG